MRVFIYACEGTYQGLHGISDQTVIEVESVEDAYEIAHEMAESVADSYGLNDYDEEEDGVENEYYGYVWRIRDEIKDSVDELDKICSQHDYETFAKNYCEAEMLS